MAGKSQDSLRGLRAPTIGIITALPMETKAVSLFLQNQFEIEIVGPGAGRRFRIGAFPATGQGKHRVVLYEAGKGNNSAARRAGRLLGYFPTIHYILMVGIAGAVPNVEVPSDHVRLGDIVISNQSGVIQFDFGAQSRDFGKNKSAKWEPRFYPRPPNAYLLESATRLINDFQDQHPWENFLLEGERQSGWKRPSSEMDILIDWKTGNRLEHPSDPARRTGVPRPFLGPIASSNTLLRDPRLRDNLRDQYGIKAVEMEASGIADTTWEHEVGYIVVRGTCDYCDENKGDDWQRNAALNAAAFARALLEQLTEERADDLLPELPFVLISGQIQTEARFEPDPQKHPMVNHKVIGQPLSPPNEDNLITKEARSYRSEHDVLLQGFFLGVGNDLNPDLALPPDKLLSPIINIGNNLFSDFLCSAISRGGRVALLVPSASSHPDIEGVGRTSIVLDLIGISVPYGRLIAVDESQIRRHLKLDFSHHERSEFRLLSSDMAYLGISGSRLALISIKGEWASFAWDLARHIFRSTEIAYKTGAHRKSPGRERLLKIFQSIPINQQYHNIFGRLDRINSVDEVFILERRIEAKPTDPVFEELDGIQARIALKEALMVGATHGSMFWQRDKNKYQEIIDSIVDSLTNQTLPKVAKISYSFPENIAPKKVFNEIAAYISTGNVSLAPNEPERVELCKGIRAHNDILLRSISDVNSIRMVITSGEKLFKDVAVWRALANAGQTLTLEVLMLNPDSPNRIAIENQSYTDKSRGFLATEIRENLRALKRMAKYFHNAKVPIRVRCRLYDYRPSFRMTFIGEHRLLVSPYVEGSRTGNTTLFYDISADGNGALIEGFKNEYLVIRSLANRVRMI